MAMNDAEIAKLLDHTAAVADPILDILTRSDPFDLKPRTFGRRWWDAIPTSTADLAATALNVADWPGTAGWEKLTLQERAEWWVKRVGSLNTVAVAFPGMFGAWTKKLPVGTLLGAASQALMVLAVGRVYGVLSRRDQIAMLGAVVFGRDVDGTDLEHDAPREFPESGAGLLKAVVKGLWDMAMWLRKLEASLSARPQAPAIFRHLGWIPLLGAAATYVGERIALHRAVTASQEWIAENPAAVED
ncbi:hypothetical protein [Gordonia iterans]